WMRSSGASAEIRRASAGVLRSSSSIVGRDGDDARALRAVAPRVPGPELDDDVARRELHLLGVEDQGDAALEHEAEIERLGLLAVSERRLRRVRGRVRRAHGVEERA